MFDKKESPKGSQQTPKDLDLSEAIDRERTQQSELLVLVSNGLEKKVKELLNNNKKSVDVNVVDQDKQAAAHIAASRNDLPMLKVLFEAGADLGCADIYGRTPAGWAKHHQNKEMADFIEKHLPGVAKPGPF